MGTGAGLDRGFVAGGLALPGGFESPGVLKAEPGVLNAELAGVPEARGVPLGCGVPAPVLQLARYHWRWSEDVYGLPRMAAHSGGNWIDAAALDTSTSGHLEQLASNHVRSSVDRNGVPKICLQSLRVSRLGASVTASGAAVVAVAQAETSAAMARTISRTAALGCFMRCNACNRIKSRGVERPRRDLDTYDIAQTLRRKIEIAPRYNSRVVGRKTDRRVIDRR